MIKLNPYWSILNMYSCIIALKYFDVRKSYHLLEDRLIIHAKINPWLAIGHILLISLCC